MKYTNVSGLKARLSEYLAVARQGETVEVRDRSTPIVRLVPVDGGNGLEVVEPTRSPRDLEGVRAVRLRRRVDVLNILREGRDQR